MPLLVSLFVLCFIGILVTAYFSIESIKALADRFRLSDTFVGAVFLSVGTSFPEFVNSIVSGFSDRLSDQPKNSLFSFYNVTGANLWQVVFLVFVMAVVAICFRLRRRSEGMLEIVNIFWEESWLSWNIVFWETIFLAFIFIFPFISGSFIIGGFNLCNFIFLIFWFYYLRYTYNSQPIHHEKERYKFFVGWNKYALVVVTILLWALFGGFAYGNFYVASKFPMDSSTSFGVILSFITSSPEFSVLCLLFKQREYRIAVGGFFGSSLFNLTLPFYSNLISGNPIMGKDLRVDTENGNVINNHKLSVWLICSVVFFVLFLASFSSGKKIGHKLGSYVTMANGVVVAVLYSLLVYFFNQNWTS